METYNVIAFYLVKKEITNATAQTQKQTPTTQPNIKI